MAKPPSWNEIHSRAREFAARWEGTTDERANSQSFWNEFFQIFGIDRKRVALFEARAERASTSRIGFVDLHWKGQLVVEQKSAGKSLEEAEAQAMDYLESIDEVPLVVITSDFANIRIRDLGGDNIPYTFELSRLPEEIDRFGFIAGYQKRNFGNPDEEAANVKAARLMGRLYEELSRNGYEGHDASVLLVRLLFLMFGDDTGMWEKGLFAEFIDMRTQEDGSDLGSQLAFLFQVLDKEIPARPQNTDELLLRFPYVNGHLFSDRIDIPAFNRAMRDELVKATQFDWGKISPAVFGSLFQAIKSREARRELGEHYTTETAIMKAIGPLFLDELRERFEQARNSQAKLQQLHDHIASIRVLDPACGCGNFLVVSYRQLRRLELEILKRLRDLSGDEQLHLDVAELNKVRIDHFYGIEIEEWPARIAETAMFLADQQANRDLSLEFGRAPDRLPIRITATIHIGNALTTPWTEVIPMDGTVYIVGNPPFGGTSFLSEEQKTVAEVVWGDIRGSGNMDFVSCWHLLAARLAIEYPIRAAFVSTNSITQGQQAPVLGLELQRLGVEIDFAHQTFAWSSEAPGQAAVHCVIIGISKKQDGKKKVLFRYPDIKESPVMSSATNINMYLQDAANIFVTNRRSPIQSGTQVMDYGSKPTDDGHLSNISTAEAAEIRRKDSVAAQYLRRIVGAQELINGGERWCLWLDGVEPSVIRTSPELLSRVSAVREFRQKSPKKMTRDDAATPHLFQERRQPTSQYLVVPRVSSETRRYVPMALFGPEVVTNDSVLTIENSTEYTFGLLHSIVFMVWNAAVSGRLESRFRISAEITYNNFPWPEAPKNKNRIEAGAQAVIAARNNHPSSTLADLYDPRSMPEDLVDAHRALDKEVLAAYGLRSTATESEILAELFRRYSELTATLLTEEKPKKTRKKKS